MNMSSNSSLSGTADRALNFVTVFIPSPLFILVLAFLVILLLPSGTRAQCPIPDASVTVSVASVCPGDSVVVTTTTTDAYTEYSLLDSATGSALVGPITGTGGGIDFSAVSVSGPVTFQVSGEYSGLALDFDGVDEAVTITGYKGISSSLARTVEAWIKVAPGTFPTNAIISWGENGMSGKKYFIRLDGAKLRLEVADGFIVGSTLLNDGEWHHIAVSHFTGAAVENVSLYVDGILESVSSLDVGPILTGNVEDVRIGRGYGTSCFEGKIDEVRIWSAFKNAGEIAADYTTCLTGSEANLEAYYTFDDRPTSNTLFDQSGNGRNGVLENMETTDWIQGSGICGCSLTLSDQARVELWPEAQERPILNPVQYTCPGEQVTFLVENSQVDLAYRLVRASDDALIDGPLIGDGDTLSFLSEEDTVTTSYRILVEDTLLSGAIEFDGGDDRMLVGGYTGILDGKGRTMEAWIQVPAGWGGDRTIFYWGNNSSLGSKNELRLEEGLLRFEVNGGYKRVEGVLLNDGLPHHVAAVLVNDGSTNVNEVKLYIDGILQSGTTSSFEVVNTANGTEVKIGSADGTRFFKGIIDEVRIWDAARTDAQILEYFNTCLETPHPNLKVYYPLNETDSSVAVDHSGNECTGSFINMTFPDAWVEGISACNRGSACGYALELSHRPIHIITEIAAIVDFWPQYPILCTGDSSEANLAVSGSSELEQYYLWNEHTGTFEDGPVPGGPDTLVFQTGPLDSNTTFSVFAEMNRGPQALHFDGIDDVVNVPGYEGITGTNPRSAEAWIKADSGLLGNFFILGWGRDASGSLWSIRLRDGQLRANVNGGQVTGTSLLNDGAWHHVAVTWENDGTPDIVDAKLYVDGLLETISASSSHSVDTEVDEKVVIGGFSGNYFQGSIDEVRIWDRVLSPGELVANYDSCLSGSEVGLQLYFNFHEEVGMDTVIDHAPFARNGILKDMDPFSDWVSGYPGCANVAIGCSGFTGDSLLIEVFSGLSTTLTGVYPDCPGESLAVEVAPTQTGVAYSLVDTQTDTIVVGPVVGTGAPISFSSPALTTSGTFEVWGDSPGIPRALEFDGINDFVEIAGYNGVPGPQSRTIEAWIKVPSGATPEAAFISWGVDLPGEKFFVRLEGGKLRCEVGLGYIVGSTLLNDGNWHHLAVTLSDDGSMDIIEAQLYVDGILEAPSTSSSRLLNTSADNSVRIGSDTEGNYFAGQLDEVRIWNLVRTTAEILETKDSCLNGVEPGLEAYYRMQEPAGSDTLVDYSANLREGLLTNMDTLSAWVEGAPGCAKCREIVAFPVEMIEDNPDIFIRDTLACGEGTTEILIPNSSTDLLYILQNNTTGTPVDSSIGNGDTLAITSGLVSGITEYSVIVKSMSVYGTCLREMSPLMSVGPMTSFSVSYNGVPICAGDSIEILLEGSQLGMEYFLVREPENSLEDGPFVGTGDSIIFNTASIDSIVAFHVLAVRQGESLAGYALKFDGVDDQIKVNGWDGITGGASRTLEAWIQTEPGLTGDQAVVKWGSLLGEASGTRFAFRLENGLIRAEVNEGFIVGSTLVNDGISHHIAVVISDDGSPDISEAVFVCGWSS